MKTSPVAASDLAGSVISVPPLPRTDDGLIDVAAVAQVTAHMRRGSVTTALWGGNANLYNIGLSEFDRLLDAIEAAAPGEDWAIPSIGADFGKAMDQVAILKQRAFPTAMVLPLAFPARPAGVATGLRRIADALGRPIVTYIKFEGYITPKDLGRLAKDGVVSFVKYAVVRDTPSEDPYLEEILQHTDRSMVVSGIGERPVVPHLTQFGLNGFTSGSVCVAPHLSDLIRLALIAGDIAEAERLRTSFLPLEDLRDAYSPIIVLHHAVASAGIAPTGPLAPFLAQISDETLLARISDAAKALLAANEQALAAAA